MRTRHDTGMTGKQERFVEEFLKDHNSTQAAARAGYKHPNIIGANLTNPKKYPVVCAAIEKGKEELRREVTADAAMLCKELCKVAFASIKSLVDTSGNIRGLHELPDDVAAAVKEFKVSYRVGVDGKGQPAKVKVIEVKFHDKLEAMSQLGKHLGLLKDVVPTINNNLIVMNWDALSKRRDADDPVEDRIREVESLTHTPTPAPESMVIEQRVEHTLPDEEGE
jgi:phage terminase small subunit